MTSITSRQARPHEVDALATMFAPHLPWIGEERLLDLLRSDDRRILVGHVDGVLAGIAGYGPAGYSRHAWALGPAATLPQFRGLGVGTALVSARLSRIDIAVSRTGIPSCLVHVASRRQAFWEGQGFWVVEVIDGTAMLCQRRDARGPA